MVSTSIKITKLPLQSALKSPGLLSAVLLAAKKSLSTVLII